MKSFLIRFATLVVMVVPGFNLAHAGSITLTFTGADSWTASWTAPGLSLLYTAGSPNTLVKTVTFTDLNPISIVFTENETASANNFGLRLTMGESVTNNSGVAWTGFTETLVDPTQDNSGAFHPQFAHFHTDPGFAGSPFTLTGGGQSARTLLFGNGTLNNGATWSPAGIGMHDFQLNGQLRSFTLVEQPVSVPEPVTSSLLGVGMLALVGLASKKHLV